jgi:hypothetical protein
MKGSGSVLEKRRKNRNIEYGTYAVEAPWYRNCIQMCTVRFHMCRNRPVYMPILSCTWLKISRNVLLNINICSPVFCPVPERVFFIKDY